MGLGAPGNRAPFLNALADRARAAGAEIACDAPVAALARSGDGFVVEAAGRRVAARAVVIATGGFQANRDLLARYMGDAAARQLRIRSRPEQTGDGLALALANGAAGSRNMDAFYGHTMVDCAIAPDMFQRFTPYFARAALLINRDGRRFVDESETFLEEGNPQAACRERGGVFYVVFDRRMYEVDAERARRYPTPPEDWLALAERHEAPLWRADTVEGLIAMLADEGVPAVALSSEIAAYNDASRAGRAGALSPPRRDFASPLERRPFVAARCVAGITATAGGIAVDDRLRVLDGAGRPLAGLFAAGVDAGGVYGRHYGGFLGWSLVSGRRAGAAAASMAR
jgi:succinate dehydrogenase/fumarate reductase flavoprotein subunit